MTEADPALAIPEAEARWTCARCEMTLRLMPESAKPELPSTWIEQNGAHYCLACRRDRAGEEALERLPLDASLDTRQRTRAQARIEFEIWRDPARPDNRIARACHTSTLAVRKARGRMGVNRPPRA